ncbi:lipase family protein [Pyxidicoccus parkwayensis]|uniref:Lipase family protein n=1 Tax=Pyxidicoccus parkwayensis TaxID=2813578 RepID=A0ABX7P029_9BACT|nr:lipase family protein [Pyxidicoccus parkwaysis]QSQ24542.1 lipase family protein [Pyxidicoccus parkwaysis]
MASTFSTAQLGITLSAISYLGQPNTNPERFTLMNTAITNTVASNWQIVWGPATQGEDLVYVASNGAGQYAVVVRGTLFDRIEDVIQDKSVSTQEALPFTASSFPNAQVSKGVVEVWTNINNMVSSVPGSGTGSLLSFLQNLSGSPSILVTGHSLGGQMATVLAAWFQSTLSNASILPITFAAPTAGNPAFASAFDSVFGSAMRYYNALDVVPRLWTMDGLESIKSLYPGGPQCGLICKTAVDDTVKSLQKADLTYTQPTASTSLPGQLYSTGWAGAFESEVNDQHRALYYMFLLGIPLATIQQLNATWAPPSQVASRSVG